MPNLLERIQRRYRRFNHEDINNRLAASRMVENWIRATMNHHGCIGHEGQPVRDWTQCDARDDRTFKRDAYYERNGRRYYSQLKFRMPDSGNDILSAVIQPYSSLADFTSICLDEPNALNDHVWARDFKFNGDWYCSLSRDWERLRILDYQQIVKPRIDRLLAEWVHSEEELHHYNRCFESQTYPGFCLRWTKDAGRGYDQGLHKIVCFMPRTMFEENEISVVEMISPRDFII